MSQPTAITIGNFDGVHRGHAALVARCRQAVGPHGRTFVLCFDPHPATVLRPNAVPLRLTTADQRKHRLMHIGVNEVIVLNPTAELLNQSPQEFVDRFVAEHKPNFVVEGRDFRFGRGREGSIETLRERERRHGYCTIEVDPVEAALADQSVVPVSSTMIRHMLGLGRVRDAALMLGHPYELAATVVRGDQRGRTIGVPTINLSDTGCMLPADGIYCGRAIIEKTQSRDAATFPAAISVGTKPTFGSHPRVCEAHLIGYDGPLDDYGWNVRLEFHNWLRDQMTYTDVNALIDQLRRDIANVPRDLQLAF